jgi:hypothetical protein
MTRIVFRHGPLHTGCTLSTAIEQKTVNVNYQIPTCPVAPAAAALKLTQYKPAHYVYSANLVRRSARSLYASSDLEQ